MCPTITVIFGKNHLPFSWLIRVFTWSRWSHCGVVVGDNVIESTATKGVVVTPLKEFIERYNDHAFATIPVKDSVAEALDRASNIIGDKYDFAAIFGIFFRTGWNQRGKWLCSEAVAHIAGTFREDYVGRITPEDLWRNSNDTVHYRIE